MVRRLLLVPMVALLALAAEGSPPPGMVFVEGGTFLMGRDVEGRPTSDSPAHPVTVKPFYLDRYEVTNARYARFIEAKGYGKEEYWSEAGREWLAGREGRLPGDWEALRKRWGDEFDSHPVVGVSWYEAEAFARFEGKRLPTEAEWERAARGTDGRAYPWGEGFATGLREDESLRTWPVGSNPADLGPAGAFDLGGNVSEWTADWYGPYPGTKFESRYWGDDAERRLKVARGGSWRALARGKRAAELDFRATRRLTEYPHDEGYPFIGFRLAMDAE